MKEGFVEAIYGHSLTHAKDRREVADCDIYYEPSKEEAESISEDAKRFLERIKKAIYEM